MVSDRRVASFIVEFSNSLRTLFEIWRKQREPGVLLTFSQLGVSEL